MSCVNDRILILDTASLLAMRMTDEALAGAGIPHFIVEFTRSGRSMEMPCAPSLGRGYRWQITVSKEHRPEAEAVLRQLPVDPATGPNPPEEVAQSVKAKRWRAYYRALGTVALIAMALLFYFMSR